MATTIPREKRRVHALSVLYYRRSLYDFRSSIGISRLMHSCFSACWSCSTDRKIQCNSIVK